MHFEGHPEEETVIDGIRIPAAFRPIDIPPSALLSTIQELRERLRWYNKQYAFLFNPDDREYREFLEQCRQDTKLLQKALQAEFTARGKQIVAERKSKLGARKAWRRITFMIRPPLLTSSVTEKNPDTRWQLEGKELTFTIHVDGAHSVQKVRAWKNPEQPGHMFESGAVSDELETPEMKELLRQHYGQWDVMAKIIADKVIWVLDVSQLLEDFVSGKKKLPSEADADAGDDDEEALPDD